MKDVDIEAQEADVGFEPWDDPEEVTVSPIGITSESCVAVFNTGATHHVFNKRKRLITFRSTAKITVKMADGSKAGVITGVGLVKVELMEGGGDQLLLRSVYLCGLLRHSFVSGISIYEEGMQFGTNESGLHIISPDGKRVNTCQRGRKRVLRMCVIEVSA